MAEEAQPRNCYECGKEVGKRLGKYFCSRECWEAWQKKNYADSPKLKRKRTLEEMQQKLKEWGKGKTDDIVDVAKNLF